MPDILNAAEVRSGTWGELWLDGEQVAECYGCQIKVNKTKEDVQRCRTLVAGKKMTGVAVTGTIRIYNATSRLTSWRPRPFSRARICAIPSSVTWTTPTTLTTSAFLCPACPSMT